MTDVMRTGGVTASDTDERARRAVSTFRTMQPTLSAYARVLTGNPTIRVEMAARDNGSTDGKRIFMRPPIELGDRRQHERGLCDKRDENLQLQCEACVIREKVMSTIYHEIAHIAFGTFGEVSEAAKRVAVLEAVKEVGGRRQAEITQRIMDAPSSRINSYMGLASMINDFLPTLVNCMEDARVDLQMFKARKGTKKMFDADVWRTFEKGVEQKDPDGNVVVVSWREYKLNAQVMVGVYCKLLGYRYKGWFHKDVVTALDDDQLTQILSEFPSIEESEGVYHLAVRTMTRLRELGFLGTPMDPDPEPEEGDDDSDQDEVSESDEENGDSSDDGGESSDDQENAPQQPDDASSEPSDEGESEDSGSGEAGEGSDSESEDESATADSTDGDIDDQDQDSSDEDGSEDPGNTGSGSSEGDESGSSLVHDSFGGALLDGREPSENEAPEDGTGGVSNEAALPDREAGETGTPTGGEVDEQDTSESGGTSGAEEEPSEATEGPKEDSSLAEESDESSDGSDRGDDSGAGADSAGPNGEGSLTGDADPSLGMDSDNHLDEPESAGSSDQLGDESSGESAQLDDSLDDGDEAGQESLTNESAGLEESDESDSGGDPEDLIDNGADDGYGGTRLEEADESPRPEMGTPDDIEMSVAEWSDHDEKPKTAQQSGDEKAIDVAVIQGLYFTTPSSNILGVRVHTYDHHVEVDGVDCAEAWLHSYWGQYGKQAFSSNEIVTDEKILVEALTEMRVAFSDNKRGKHERHRKTGKVDARALGRRAPIDDPRLFKKKVRPGKKDYFVVIGFDVSGSTFGVNLAMEKEAVAAQAELLSRLGVKFAVYAHSGDASDPNNAWTGGIDMDIYQVKGPNEHWTSQTQKALREIGPHSVNLDGHTLEYYRKLLDADPATDKIIMYYTDGKMPAENEDEELAILQREIKICKQRGYTLMGVGIRTDSPRAHGLDTVQVDTERDVVKVVKHLQKRLAE